MRRLLIALLLTTSVLVAAAGPAAAHAELLEADPPADGEAVEGTSALTLTLVGWDPSRPVEVAITDASGADVTAGEPEVDARASRVRVPTEPLAVGQHVVHWHAWADDGDGLSEGTFRFTVTEAPDSGWRIWLVWAVALAVPAAIFLRPGTRRGQAD